MTTYMVLPGGWAGGWQARRVARILEQAGRSAVSPTFADLEHPGATIPRDELLYARLQEMLALIAREDLHDLILVGFNLSGEVAAGLARLAPERVTHLVCADALLACDRQSLAEGVPPGAISAGAPPFWGSAREAGSGQALGSHGPWEPAELGAKINELWPALPRTFVHCTAHSCFASWTAPAAHKAREAGWICCELPLDGANRIATPEEVAAQLLTLR